MKGTQLNVSEVMWLFGPKLGECRHCRMNSSRDPYWSSEEDHEDFLGFILSKTSL